MDIWEPVIVMEYFGTRSTEKKVKIRYANICGLTFHRIQLFESVQMLYALCSEKLKSIVFVSQCYWNYYSYFHKIFAFIIDSITSWSEIMRKHQLVGFHYMVSLKTLLGRNARKIRSWSEILLGRQQVHCLEWGYSLHAHKLCDKVINPLELIRLIRSRSTR